MASSTSRSVISLLTSDPTRRHHHHHHHHTQHTRDSNHTELPTPPTPFCGAGAAFFTAVSVGQLFPVNFLPLG